MVEDLSIEEWTKRFTAELANGDPLRTTIMDALILGAKESGAIKRLSFYNLRTMCDHVFDAVQAAEDSEG